MALLASFSALSFAQEGDDEITESLSASEGAELLKSKKGISILPEGGDYALSINAVPLINLISGTVLGSGNQGFGFVNNGVQEIRGKRFLDPTTALRGGINVTYSSMSYTNAFDDPADPPNTDNTQQDQLKDVYTRSNSYFTLSGGLEKRRGAGRVQGIYGAMATFTFGGSSGYSDTYNYAVGLGGTTGNDNAGDGTYETDWNAEGAVTYENLNDDVASDEYRIVERTSSGGIGIGVLGFVGVEYFFAPKMSLGGEFHFGLTLAGTSGKITEKREYTNDGVKEYTSVGVSSSSASFMPTNNSGSIFLNFHF